MFYIHAEEFKMVLSYKSEVHRKLIHLSFLWMLFAMFYLNQMQSITLFSGLLISGMLFEILRLKSKYAAVIISKYMGSILRAHERSNTYFQLTDAFYVVLAALIVVLNNSHYCPFYYDFGQHRRRTHRAQS